MSTGSSDQYQPGAAPQTRYRTDIDYRPDIDGLRGIAVLLVVGYHAFPAWVRGGFVGVDVFFVISGFLISSIVFKNLEAGTFSFVGFYERRIKRIFPALALVLSATLLVGWFELAPNEYKQLGWHVTAGAGFAANLALWNETGYFGDAAIAKPLLHLWSLGIEEQFYLVWPLVLWLSWKLQLKQRVLFALIIGISFALNIQTISTDAVADFYSPLPRFWELILGCLLAHLTFYTVRRGRPAERIAVIARHVFPLLVSAAREEIVREVSAIAGVLLIGLAAVVTSRDQSFPGWWVLLPAVGTFLAVAGGANTWLSRRLLSVRPLVWVGLISYPLYLWHWPLLSVAHTVKGDTLAPVTRIVLVLFSVALAWITYQWIEKPVRFRMRGRKVSVILSGLMIAIGCAGYYAYNADGFPFRIGDKADFETFFFNAPPEYRYATTHNLFEAYRDQCDFFDNRNPKARIRGHIDPSCYTPATDEAVLVWGDSHAQHLYYGLSQTLPKRISILQVATSSCTPALTDRHPDPLGTCNTSNRFALKTIADKKPQTVVLAQGSAHLATNFEEMADELGKLGVRRVLLLGPVPHWTPPLYKVIMNEFWASTPQRSFRSLNKEIMDLDRALKQKYSNSTKLTYISLIDFFCNDAGCLLYLGNNRRDGIVTHDYGHLTPRASEYLSKHLLAPIVVESFPN